jgi:hypothetical protein
MAPNTRSQNGRHHRADNNGSAEEELDIVPTGRLFEGEDMPDIPEEQYAKFKKDPRYKVDIVWRNVAIFAVLHTLAVVGLYFALFKAKAATLLFSECLASSLMLLP